MKIKKGIKNSMLYYTITCVSLHMALLLGSMLHGGASLSPQPTPRPTMTGVIGVSREEHWGRFQRFVHEYERIYESHNEFVNRWEVFAENSEAIAAHTGSYSMDINKFSDKRPHELTTMIGPDILQVRTL